MDLLLHPETEKAIGHALAGHAHAFLLNGPAGSGKLTLAEHMARQFLQVKSLDNQPGFRMIQPAKGSIGIDAIRTIQQFMRLKTTGSHHTRRVLIVEAAHTMTVEAQNAFLKLLEEPPADTRLILTLAAGSTMLPTIHSRVQVIEVQSPSKAAITEHFLQQGKSAGDIQKALLLSGNHIGLMTGLLDDTSNHPLLEYVDRAKQFLTASAFERLAHLDQFAKDRDELALLLQALKRMSATAFEQAATTGKQKQAAHWHSIRHAVLGAETILKHNPNVKLTLTDLSLAI